MHRIIADVLIQSFYVMHVNEKVLKLSSLYLNPIAKQDFSFPSFKKPNPYTVKMSCCVQGNPCCHRNLSALSFTACLTCVVLAFAKEQLHRCDYSVFVPASC